MSKKYQKINTFTMKPSIAQIFTYLIITLQACIFYTMIRPNITTPNASITLTTLYTVSLALLLITTFICSYIDPSDQVMVSCKNGQTGQHRDRTSELSYCQYCRSYVTVQAKHCKVCARCVSRFDHHCMWINNCIGDRNYAVFFGMIVAAFVHLGGYLASVVVVSLERQWWGFMGFIITIWVVMAIVFVLWFMLFNLNLLHIYLQCKGYTTYQFIIARRQEQRARQHEEMMKKNKKQQQQRKKKQQQRKKSQKTLQKKQQQPTESNIIHVKNKQTESPNKGESSHLKLTESNSQVPIPNNEKQMYSADNKLKQSLSSVVRNNNIFNDEQNYNYNEKSNNVGIEDESRSKNNDFMSKTGVVNEQIINRDDDVNFSRSSSGQSIKINRFFMKNRSFGIIFGNQRAYSPQRRMSNTSHIVERTDKKRTPIPLNQSRTRSRISTITIKSVQQPSKNPQN